MESTQTQEALDKFITALYELEEGGEDASVDTIAALFAEDSRIVNSALLLDGAELTGSDGAREFWLDYKKTIGVGKSDFHYSIVNGNNVGLFWTTSVSGGTGKYHGATLLDFDESGKIRYFQGYYDTKQLNRAIGTEEK